MDIKSSYLVDSHCHLNFNDFKDDFDSVLLRADESNVKIMVSISTELDEIDNIIKISEHQPTVSQRPKIKSALIVLQVF